MLRTALLWYSAASAAQIAEQIQNSVFSNSGQAACCIYRNTFDQSRDYLGALFSLKPIHDVRSYDTCTGMHVNE